MFGTVNTGAAIEVRGVSKRFGDVLVLRDVDIRVDPGTTVALLGPSGCGKTTLLRIVAGLERPDGGEIAVGGRTLTGPGTFVPPERRRVGMVFQDWALFPHLSVARNVAYGLPRAERTSAAVDRVLDMVGLTGMGDRAPGTLSGGQQQRVALARALAPRPAVLLLDEPFSNLDSALRVRVRAEVAALLADLAITCVFVTHDQDEAFVLGGEVAVMHAGRVIQQDHPAMLYSRPATPWVASFVGDANLVDGEAAGEVATTPVGTVPLAAESNGPVQVLLRPEELRVENGSSGGDATVTLVEFYGHDTVYVVALDSGVTHPLRVRVGSAPVFVRGDRVSVRYAGPPAVAYRSASTAGSAETAPAPA